MDQSAEQLENTLSAYKEQYQTVEAAIWQDPGNEGLQQVKKDLWEVIKLTEDLLKMKKKSQLSTVDIPEPPSPTPLSPSDVSSPSTFSPKFAVGVRCSAKWSQDGLWYEAVIDAVPDSQGGFYAVTYSGYGNSAKVKEEDITPLHTAPSSSSSSSSSSSFAASAPASSFESTSMPASSTSEKKGKKRAADGSDEDEEGSDSIPGMLSIPKSLKILPTDSEEVRTAKKRRIHAIKTHNRKLKLQEKKEPAPAQNTWQQFTTTASHKKKLSSGLRSIVKNESIFKSPQTVEGKVGVTGSGKGLTTGMTFKVSDVKVTKKALELPEDLEHKYVGTT